MSRTACEDTRTLTDISTRVHTRATDIRVYSYQIYLHVCKYVPVRTYISTYVRIHMMQSICLAAMHSHSYSTRQACRHAQQTREHLSRIRICVGIGQRRVFIRENTHKHIVHEYAGTSRRRRLQTFLTTTRCRVCAKLTRTFEQG